MYQNFADFNLNCQKALVTCTLIFFTEKYKAKSIV